MYGAILGDMIGAPYEFDQGDKTKNFELFDKRKWVRYTDDSVMTLAIANAIMNAGAAANEKTMKQEFVLQMQNFGNRYAQGEYGGRFAGWLRSSNPQPYGSYGNGSAMRVSAIGWAFNTIERTREVARWSAEVTHNHPEGIKGAESVASAIFLLRNGKSKDEVKQYIIDEFGYDLSRTCDEIRPEYHHVESCQETVPEAITAFLEGTDFEDVIRTAVSLGGDCDTLTCIAGSLAEAFYGVPDDMKAECDNRLPDELLDILKKFFVFRVENNEDLVNAFINAMSMENLAVVAPHKSKYYERYNIDWLINEVKAGKKFKYVTFWQADEGCENNVFSQWYKGEPIIINGRSYVTAEQYMMSEKALLFGDMDSYAKIMKEPDPAKCKKLGKNVYPFFHHVWKDAFKEIVFHGNLGKLQSDISIINALLETEDAVLVEASPYDDVYGAGLSKDSLLNKDGTLKVMPWDWHKEGKTDQAQNNLGFILMGIRDLFNDLMKKM